MTLRKIVLAGLGLHARHYHYHLLEELQAQYGFEVVLVIDLQDQAEAIREYLAGSSLQPRGILLLDPRYRQTGDIPPEAEARLNALKAAGQIDGLIISTEPKSHKAYALWAIQNNVDVLMDKPITAPVMLENTAASAAQIFTDYLDLEAALRTSSSHVVVNAPRRYHAGIDFIRQYLASFVQEFNTPITMIDIYHAEGQWNMPDEFWSRENHPYKYGYGMLLHSGYHHADLLLWLTRINNLLTRHQLKMVDLVSRHITPRDFLTQVDQESYRTLFGTDPYRPYYQRPMLEQMRHFGETDISALAQFKDREAAVTTGILNLFQTSFSRRAWANLPADTYKNNGRLRHERINIQVGPLLNIQAHSYLGENQTGFRQGGENGAETYFDISVFRNSDLVGGNTIEKHNLVDAHIIECNQTRFKTSLYGKAREDLLKDWLEEKETHSEFSDHRQTDQFVAKLYECMFRQNQGLPSFLSYLVD
jgi:Predicted dehydrogenases and related proteins